MTEDILDEQVAYYRARAPEYDEWWQRERSFDLGREHKQRWDAEVDEVERALDAFAPSGAILELASGTGWWTQRLASYSDDLTCVDISPETVEIARTRAPDARFVLTDIFAWEPDRAYDVVFFSFWLSHVPGERFASFWSLVGRALQPDGRVFFIDNQRPPASTSMDGRSRRTLNDGRTFTIVKIFRDPPDLEAQLDALGWDASVRATANHFIHGSARR